MARTVLSQKNATARKILGSDFISPGEIADARGIGYTTEQLTTLGETLPTQDALKWCHDNGMMMLAGPPTPMSVLDVRALNPDNFHPAAAPVVEKLSEPAQIVADKDKVAPGWLALRKEPVDNSFGKSWLQQQALVVAPMTVPNVAEVAWCLTTCKAVRDAYLLAHLFVRTSSLGCSGHVLVGQFDAGGVRVGYCWDGLRSSNLGVWASRKF